MWRKSYRCIQRFLAIACSFLPTLAHEFGMVLRLMTGWAIILSLRWARRRTFTSDLGIHMGKMDIGLGGASLLVVGVIASYAIPKILRPLGYAPGISNDQTWKYLATPFQVLNEEWWFEPFSSPSCCVWLTDQSRSAS
jgi:hypothetical protein